MFLSVLIGSIIGLSTPYDKIAHASVTYALNHLGYTACRAERVFEDEASCYALSAAGILSVGLLWELHGNKDPLDMGANILGSAGFGLTLLWKFP